MSKVEEVSYNVYSAMQEGEPLATYKKVCVGKIAVRVINPYTEEIEDVILEGDPHSPSTRFEDITISVWTNKEDSFFKKMNQYHFEKGNLIKVEKEKKEVQQNFNVLSDEEIEEILNKPFFTLKNALPKMTSSAVVLRLLNRAIDLERSEKFTEAIKVRLSEIQETE